MQPLAADEWGDDEYAAFGTLLGIPGAKVPRAGSGHIYDPVKFPVVGLLARHPSLAAAYLTFNAYLLQRGELPAALREQVILRIVHEHQSAFEWGQHVTMAGAAGITDEQITALTRGNDGFTDGQRLVLEATDELLANGQATDETWNRLVAALGTHQAIEVIFVVGAYVTTGMEFNTWKLPPQPESAVLPGRHDSHRTPS